LEAWLTQIPVAVWIGGFLALYMAWAIGANDVANAMGTSVGSGALTVRNAIIAAAVFEFAGAFLAGGHVTNTVRKGMLDMSIASQNPEIILYGMLGALASAGTLLAIATAWGLPVSTTHSIVGAIVGFGAVGFGIDAVNWVKVAGIVMSWGTSPLIGGGLAFLIFTIIRKTILDQDKPLERAQRLGPFFFFYVFFMIGLVTLFKGLKKLNLDYSLGEAVMISIGLGFVGMLLGWLFLRRVHRVAGESGTDEFESVERGFVVMQILTACAVAFAHGSNDVANGIGPLAAIYNLAYGGSVAAKTGVAPWMLAIGGIGIVVGLATWGYRVMETIGKKITELTPSRGFAAELGAATTIAVASRLGIPVSTTHILVGAVLGVGLARGIGALDMRVVGSIVVSWVATLPAAALMSIVFFYFFKGLLG
jgi:PiT family inorganic phosphate transporter